MESIRLRTVAHCVHPKTPENLLASLADILGTTRGAGEHHLALLDRGRAGWIRDFSRGVGMALPLILGTGLLGGQIRSVSSMHGQGALPKLLEERSAVDAIAVCRLSNNEQLLCKKDVAC